jgi:hypothetical protein
MNLADIVDALVAAGGTAEQVAAVVRAAHAKDDERAEARRTKEREKKARQRAAAKAVPHMSPIVPVDTEGQVGTVGDMVSNKEKSPAPLKEKTLPFVEVPTVRAREGSASEAALIEPIFPAIAVPSVESEFIEFWAAYPHRVGRPEAFKAFLRARAGERVKGKPPRKPVTLATIMAGVDGYVRDKPPDHNWLNPSTFLNQERYFDERAPPTTARKPLTATEFAEVLDEQRRRLNEEESDREPSRKIAYLNG